jgi:hypothetical protein
VAILLGVILFLWLLIILKSAVHLLLVLPFPVAACSLVGCDSHSQELRFSLCCVGVNKGSISVAVGRLLLRGLYPTW